MRLSPFPYSPTRVLPILALLLPLGTASAQMVGARADPESTEVATTPTLDHEAIENYITIEGKVEERLEPTALRIVLALLVEQPTASDCEAECRRREEEFLKALVDLKISRDAIVVDFISVLPVYQWEAGTRGSESVVIEERSGFRMQSNVHVQVADEKQARTVLKTAFQLGISDVIAFDYWNKDVDRHKKTAREKALKAAREKAELLLGSFFQDTPRPINVHESTRVVYPRSLYASFENTYEQEFMNPFRRSNLPHLRLAKPKNTYYRGLLEDTDVQAEGLPLRPQISVVSTVRLYYATPKSAKDVQKAEEPLTAARASAER